MALSDPGKFTQEITVIVPSPAQDGLGFETEAKADGATFYGQVLTEKGREFVASGRDTSQKSISIITWYRDDLAPKMELRWQSEDYEIVGVVNDYQANQTQINAVWTEGRE